LVPGKGWRLSEAYDMNPVPWSDGLKLNITEADNALDLELAREVAEYFRLSLAQADEIIENFMGIVAQWRTIADGLGLPLREQERMSEAFRVANG
jgi:serine/threonine-protein kinase HipA